MAEENGGAKIFSLPTRYHDPFRKKIMSIASTVAESLFLLQQLNAIYNKISQKRSGQAFLEKRPRTIECPLCFIGTGQMMQHPSTRTIHRGGKSSLWRH